MRETHRNPYTSSSLCELSAAASRMARDLAAPATRTPAQRKELARNCQELLTALAIRISPDTAGAAAGADEGMVAAYGRWLRLEQDMVRNVVLQRAAEDALGMSADHEMALRVYDRKAYATDEDVLIQVERLERWRRQQERKARRLRTGSAKPEIS